MHGRQFPSNSDALRRWLCCARFSAALLVTTIPATAQNPAAPPQSVAASDEALKRREQELEAARLEQRNSAELQAKLKAEIAAIGEDRSKLNQQLIDSAGRVRDVEGRIADSEARLQSLDGREHEIRASLDSRRS